MSVRNACSAVQQGQLGTVKVPINVINAQESLLTLNDAVHWMQMKILRSLPTQMALQL